MSGPQGGWQGTPPMPAKSGMSPVVIIVIVVAAVFLCIPVAAIVAAIAIPGFLAASRASNERSSSATLKTFATAEADFRANDRDGNRVLDYWTGDVYGLYGLLPVQGMSTTLPGDSPSDMMAIKLIEPSVATADGCFRETGAYSKVFPASTIVAFAPKAGYFFRAFHAAEDVNTGVPTPLQNDTDGEGLCGVVHDYSRFAFASLPVARANGKFIYVINEDNTMWRHALPSDYRATFTGGPTSSSSWSGTGVPRLLEGSQLVYPRAPESEFSRMD